jgi:hypothetical protein
LISYFLDNYGGDGAVGVLAPYCHYRMLRSLRYGCDANMKLADIDTLTVCAPLSACFPSVPRVSSPFSFFLCLNRKTAA